MTKVLFNIGQDTIYGVRGVDTLVTAKSATRRISGDLLITRDQLRETDSKPFTIDLAPTALGQAWIITVSPDNGDSFSGYYKVPAGDTVNFTDLIEVDPDTLDVDQSPDPEWWAVANSTINSGKVVGDHLILTRNDGVEVDAGNVRGLPGLDGDDGAPGRDGSDGVNGAPGLNGVSVISTAIDANGDLLVTLSDGQVLNAGRARGIDGVDGKTFGLIPDAVGDGVADDTAAVQAFVSSGGGFVAGGSYRVSETIVMGSNSRIVSDDAVFIASVANQTVISITGDDAIFKAKIDGASLANYGVRTSGLRPIVSADIRNLYSATNTCRAIEMTNPHGGVVKDCTIDNVFSVGDSTLGNGPGFSRAIMIYYTVDAEEWSYVCGNKISNIAGEEGDAIALLSNTGGNYFASGKTVVSDNDVSNVSRRYIKVQSSDVDVLRNTVQQTRDDIVLNTSNAIDFISSNRVKACDNIVRSNPLGVGISVVGKSGWLPQGVVVSGNKITGDIGKTSIYLNYLNGFTVTGNSISGGGNAISSGNSTNSLIEGNSFVGLDANASAVRVTSTNTAIMTVNNTSLDVDKAEMFYNVSANAVSQNNIARTA